MSFRGWKKGWEIYWNSNIDLFPTAAKIKKIKNLRNWENSKNAANLEKLGPENFPEIVQSPSLAFIQKNQISISCLTQ